MAVVAASAGLASIRHAIMPRWLAIAGMVIAVGLLIPFVSWAVFGLFTLWVLAVGVALSRRVEAARPAPRETATPTPV
jgi:uncharacterized membrane protein